MTDDKGVNHIYDVTGAVYDPDSPDSLLGIPFLSKFFAKEGEFLDDETWILTRATRSHFQWDHGKHERHFQHGQSMFPELWLYQGNSYWKSFCVRMKQFLDDKVNYAFSSAFSIKPVTEQDDKLPQQRHALNVVSDNEGDESDDEEDN